MKSAKREGKTEERKLRGIYLSDDAVAMILNYSKENHLSGGISGALEYIAFQFAPKSTNVTNAVTLGKLIEAHRDGDEQKFKTYVEFFADAYEQKGNDRGARIIRNSYTDGGNDTAKVILDATSPDRQDVAVYYETGYYEPDVLGSGGSYRGVTTTSSAAEAMRRLDANAANYIQRVTLYKKDGKVTKKEVAEYGQIAKEWRNI